jgi:MraZ protein
VSIDRRFTKKGGTPNHRVKKVFRGANSINLDSKGRIAVPAKYRQGIVESTSSHMIITCDPYDNCLLIFPLEHWGNTETYLQSLSNSKPLHRRLKRIMLAHATEVDMDANGRLLIPSVLRERAQLQKEVMLIGDVKKFQLWDEALWHKQAEEDMAVMSGDDQDSDELQDFSY